MSYHRSRARGPLQALGTLATQYYGNLCCPVCGARGSVNAVRPVPPAQPSRLHCGVCGSWTPYAAWGGCPVVVDTYPGYYPVFIGGGRRGGGRRGGGRRHHGGHHGGYHGGHHGHHGFGDVVELPPTPSPGDPGEEVALLRRVAAAQEQFNRQDLMMRRWQLVATVALPATAAAWAWLWPKIKPKLGL